MYEELVKRLREEASSWCANCCYKCSDNVCGAPDDRKKDCDEYTKLQAADAIEELSRDLDSMNEASMTKKQTNTICRKAGGKPSTTRMIILLLR